ncbi:hypothetical protein [Rhodococcus chondri]|uniref:Uncharacterized protein n=1 Tax=Rhodococcus chondri TaxID=3065941 RepID=A0ABU7JV08_9NOCA|nr:hypothetical protein [Rhodococcus sp. CC-R104]MEE2033857.1 hypothetical protein [Rhodococcus sp. CC-R104]
MAASDLGGDPVCWIDRVCPECGLFLDDPGAPCPRCGHRPADEHLPGMRDSESADGGDTALP